MEAIVVASFGTSYEQAYKKSIGKLAQDLRDRYPDHLVLESYSSEVVRKILAKRGKETYNFSQALEEIKARGIKKVSTLMLYIIDGVEYEKVQAQGEAFQEYMDISYTKPLLMDCQYPRVAETIGEIFPGPTVLMGHGSYHESDVHYENLQEVLGSRSNKHFVGTVEGDLDIEDILAYLDKSQETQITLAPFLLVAGDHAQNDMADPDDDESWYRVLKNHGYDVSLDIKGLCERPEINRLFIEKLEAIV